MNGGGGGNTTIPPFFGKDISDNRVGKGGYPLEICHSIFPSPSGKTSRYVIFQALPEIVVQVVYISLPIMADMLNFTIEN